MIPLISERRAALRRYAKVEIGARHNDRLYRGLLSDGHDAHRASVHRHRASARGHDRRVRPVIHHTERTHHQRPRLRSREHLATARPLNESVGGESPERDRDGFSGCENLTCWRPRQYRHKRFHELNTHCTAAHDEALLNSRECRRVQKQTASGYRCASVRQQRVRPERRHGETACERKLDRVGAREGEGARIGENETVAVTGRRQTETERCSACEGEPAKRQFARRAHVTRAE